jgi:hypothetical protein
MKAWVQNIFFVVTLLICHETFGFDNYCHRSSWDLSLSSGVVIKSDRRFKEIYGRVIPDIITGDACYWFCDNYGVGVKGSYWAVDGKTTILKRTTHLEEVPLVAYLRARVGYQLQFYGSLGVGAIFVKEKSYLGHISQNACCGEVELGTNYYIYDHVYLTSAFRYIYCRKEISGTDKIADFGGFGLRAGLGIGF